MQWSLLSYFLVTCSETGEKKPIRTYFISKALVGFVVVYGSDIARY